MVLQSIEIRYHRSARRLTVTGYTPASIEAVHSQRRQNVPSQGSSYQRIIIGHCAPWLHSPEVHLQHSITRLLPSAAQSIPFDVPDVNPSACARCRIGDGRPRLSGPLRTGC